MGSLVTSAATSLAMAWLLLFAGQAPLRERVASYYLERQPAPAFQVGSVEEAMRIQAEVVQELVPHWGRPVGYKAALTTPEAQARFLVDHPLRGTLLEKMLLPDGSSLPSRFGARPMFEGDFILRVGSDAIQKAETDEELLASVDAMIPFIELPDLLYGEEVTINGPLLAAINVAARYGIVGTPVPFPEGVDRYELLASIQVELVDEGGKVLSQGGTGQLLGHPVHVIRWLRDGLRAEGRRLHAGDLLSLGSMTDIHAVIPGTTIRTRYRGLGRDGLIELTVKFE